MSVRPLLYATIIGTGLSIAPVVLVTAGALAQGVTVDRIWDHDWSAVPLVFVASALPFILGLWALQRLRPRLPGLGKTFYFMAGATVAVPLAGAIPGAACMLVGGDAPRYCMAAGMVAVELGARGDAPYLAALAIMYVMKFLPSLLAGGVLAAMSAEATPTAWRDAESMRFLR